MSSQRIPVLSVVPFSFLLFWSSVVTAQGFSTSTPYRPMTRMTGSSYSHSVQPDAPMMPLPAVDEDTCCDEGDECDGMDDESEPRWSPLCPGTLLQWSADPNFDGGPDLEEPLVTDRPDFTEASSTVGLGAAQLEAGYTFVFDDGPLESIRAHSFGEPLMRIGLLANWFELRLATGYFNEQTTTNGVKASVSGSQDLIVGAKIGLTPQAGILPEMALVTQAFVPTASTNNFGAGEILPMVNWLYAWEINDRWSTAGSSQIIRELDATTNNPFIIFAQSWTVGYSVCDQVGLYTEWFALIPDGADTNQSAHFLNGGVTYLLNNDVQFAVRVGTGLNDSADDFFAGAGISIRFH